jgi:hypothetical protein
MEVKVGTRRDPLSPLFRGERARVRGGTKLGRYLRPPLNPDPLPASGERGKRGRSLNVC